MRRAPSPAPSTAISAASRMPTARPCSSTRSASFRSTPRSSCCARSRPARSSGSAAASSRPSTSGSSPRPTAASPRRSPRGRFREDLYYRLNVVHVPIPPLARPASDIPPLARHLLARIAEQPGMRHLSITDDGLAVLMRYGWPGNVRQLQNALFRAAVLCDGNALTAADFPQIATGSRLRQAAPTITTPSPERRLAAAPLSPTAPASPSTNPTAICARSTRSRPTSSASPSAIIAAA